MIDRRSFVKTITGAGAAAFAPLRFPSAETRLVILHTNDTHSRIDPFPMDGGRFEGLGGVSRRAALIKRIRAEERNVLLLDSGDMFQGTPYFNFFGGEIEFRALSAMRYDVATLGNHEFDNGIEGFDKMLPFADFAFVCANYDFSGSVVDGKIAPSTIRTFEGIKVGIFGLGIDFEGLILPQDHISIDYLDPIPVAKRVAAELREQGCSLVICLSHLGYRYRSDKVCDTDLANLVPDVDIILGGHTHTFMDEPDRYALGDTGFTLVNQVGWAGIRLGRIDVTFRGAARTSEWQSAAYVIGQEGRTRAV